MRNLKAGTVGSLSATAAYVALSVESARTTGLAPRLCPSASRGFALVISYYTIAACPDDARQLVPICVSRTASRPTETPSTHFFLLVLALRDGDPNGRKATGCLGNDHLEIGDNPRRNDFADNPLLHTTPL
ncbi:hypothetical protein KM043_001864 [Ampulex compressa]|nr:hypothetical protein KM043_001864 [Ampulex compressa]